MMRLGEADIMLGPNRNAEREAYMAYTGAYFPPADKAFYVYPGTPAITSYEDLAGKAVAVQAGAKYFERFDSDRSLRKVECQDYVVAMEKVLTGECDVVVMPVQLGDYLLSQENIELEKSPYLGAGQQVLHHHFQEIRGHGPAGRHRADHGGHAGRRRPWSGFWNSTASPASGCPARPRARRESCPA